jgi:hypothetical protein
MRSALFWDITQRRVINPHRRFGTPIGPILKGKEVQDCLDFLTLVDGADRLSVRNCHSMPSNIPEERRAHQLYCFTGHVRSVKLFD